MKKILWAAAITLALTSTASADVFDDIFEPQTTQADRSVSKVRHRREETSEQESYGGSHMIASFYGHGEKLSRYTASGAVFNPGAYTAAHKTLPFGTHLRVCYRGCVTVVINDRGPFVAGRQLDLSYGAASAIGMHSVASVSIERL